jgi:hypothetical protein
MISILRLIPKGLYAYALFLPILLFLTISLPVQAQQVQEEWARQYGSAIPTLEYEALVAGDAEGNTYVVGTSTIAGMEPRNRSIAIVAVKYNPVGEEVWRNAYRNDAGITARSIAWDETGLYVAASTIGTGVRTIMYLLKFNTSDGQLAWGTSEGPGTFTDGIEVLADKRGGIVVVGSVRIIAPADITFLAKYDASNGNKLWEQNLSIPDAPAAYQQLADIALDSNGDIYLAGTRGIVENASQVLTTKRSGADGSLIWQQSYDTNLQDRAVQLALDNTGGVYTLGVSYSADPNAPERSFLIKYQSNDGAQLWTQEVIGTGIPDNLLADSAGGLYLSRTVQGVYQIVKYSTGDGRTAWIKPIAGEFVAMDVDTAGNLYVASRPTGGDYLVRRYNANSGDTDWEQLAPNREGFDETLTDLAVSDAGLVHLVGTYTEPSVNVSKILVAAHQASSGTLVFKTTFPGTIPGADYPTAITTDSEGNIYIAGRGRGDVAVNISDDILVIKYSPAGDLVWAQTYGGRFSDIANSIAVDEAGHVYVLGTTVGSDSRPDAVLLKYSGETGDLIWETIHGPGQANFGREMKLDKQGGIYITGSANSMFDVRSEEFITKINPETGESFWGKAYSPYYADPDMFALAAFTIDEAGDVYVTGTIGAAGVANNLVLVKYAGTDGRVVWLENYNSRNRQAAHQATDVAVDNAGGVYVAAYNDLGTDQRESYLLKYSAADGQQLWLQPAPNQGSTPGRLDFLTLDNIGGAYVGGFVNGVWHIIKFTTMEPGIAWQSPYQGFLTAIEADSAGGVYATGISNNNILTTKYRAADGLQVWEVLKETNSDVALLALDTENNVIVSGTVFSRETNFDVLTVKYSQSGEPICDIPVQVQLYLAPYAIRAGWQVRTTADFGDYILTEDTGVRWTWGDGTTPSISYTAFGTSRITGQHTYERAGIYRVGLDFSESCLRPENEGYEQWQVIYDPEAGNVVGAGWQNSPQGIYPLMASSGQLNFAFGVRYSGRNATTPQGHLLLQFSNRDVFWGRSVEWLVITGNRAIWKGIGTVQGKGRYGYVVSVQDAGRRALNDPNDQLRIRIWDMDRGNAIVYDNFELGGEIYNLAGTAGPTIARGNIVINGRSILDELLALNTSAIASIEAKEVQAYPNPAHALTTIRFTTAEDSAYELHLYDMRGGLVQKVQQGHAKAGATTEVQLDVSALAKGMYLARISSADKTQTVKIVVER